jgi:hypothetical protein
MPNALIVLLDNQCGSAMTRQDENPKKNTIHDKIAELDQKRTSLELGGGKERIGKQHSRHYTFEMPPRPIAVFFILWSCILALTNVITSLENAKSDRCK